MAISASKTIIRAVVPKTTDAAIGRLAKASGKSRSAVIAEFLSQAEPAIKRLAGMLEVASSQANLFPKSAVAELEAALDDLSGTTTDVLDRMEGALQLPLEPPQRPKRKHAEARAARPAKPPRRHR